MRAAIISITPELLVQALSLPPGTVIHQMNFDARRQGAIEAVVEHHSLPEPVEGRLLPVALVIFRTTAAHYEVES